MCTFLSALPKKSKSNGIKKPNLLLSMKPCKDDENGKKTWYRFRLLAWTSPEKNDRDDAFIERFVHQIWKKDLEKGYSYIDDEVTCPVTKHVKFEGNRYDGCPICKLANQYFMTWKESGWKNKEAAKVRKIELEKQAARDTAAKFEGIIVKIKVREGADGRLYGSVTTKDIAEALAEQFGIEIDKRKIVLDEQIKAYGTYTLDVKLYPEISGKLNVLVCG